MTSRSTSLLIFVLALAAIASGCGSGAEGNSEPSTSIETSSISKAEFVEKANAICKSGKPELVDAISEYQKKHLDVVSVKLVPDTARKVIGPELQAQIDQIRSLGAPPGDAAEIEKFFASLFRGVDEVIAIKPTTFEEAERMFVPAGENALRYGIDQCEYLLVD